MKFQKVPFVIISIMILVISSSLYPAEKGQKDIQIIDYSRPSTWSSMNSPSYQLYAGFPLCSDVIQRAEEEINAIAMSIASHDLDSILNQRIEKYKEHNPTLSLLLNSADIHAEVTSTCPSFEIEGAHFGLNDPHSPGRCFAGDTPLFRLMQKKIPGYIPDIALDEKSLKELPNEELANLYVEKISIFKLYKEFSKSGNINLVLSSTYGIFQSPNYQEDCWAEFDSVDQYEYDGELQNVEVKNGSIRNLGFTFKLTPNHKILAKDSTYAPYKWVTAGSLESGDYLYNGTKHLPFFVVQNTPIENKEDKEVYTLTVPKVFSLYIGSSLDARILPHNGSDL